MCFYESRNKSNKQKKIMKKNLLKKGTTLSLSGMGTALAGEKVLWKIFSATKGKYLNGICESRAFLNWCAKLIGGTGILTGAKLLKYLKYGGWSIAIIGTVLVIYSVCDKNKIAVYDTANQ